MRECVIAKLNRQAPNRVWTFSWTLFSEINVQENVFELVSDLCLYILCWRLYFMMSQHDLCVMPSKIWGFCVAVVHLTMHHVLLFQKLMSALQILVRMMRHVLMTSTVIAANVLTVTLAFTAKQARPEFTARFAARNIFSQLGLICVGGWGRTYTCCTLHALTCACDEWSVVGFYVRLLRLFTDIDECLSQPCQNAGNCTDFVNGFECTCVSGYTGLLCETGM